MRLFLRALCMYVVRSTMYTEHHRYPSKGISRSEKMAYISQSIFQVKSRLWLHLFVKLTPLETYRIEPHKGKVDATPLSLATGNKATVACATNPSFNRP